MRPAWQFLSRGTRALWLCAGAWALLALGCQNIAGVEEVKYGGGSAGGNCDTYCAQVLASCPGDIGVYADLATCKKVCAHFPAGNVTKPAGNTLACRAEQAKFAAQQEAPIEKRAHCPAAGPGGATYCSMGKVPDCEGYCTLYMGACPTISKDWGFGTQEECVRKCAALPPAMEYATASARESGDTLACRLYYASAATLDPDTHCRSAGLKPAGACLGSLSDNPSCKDYCRVVDVACTGDLQVYESRTQCEKVCAATPPGSRTDSGLLDTVGCRSYHSYNALLIDPRAHCPHSGPGGDGVCSAPKDPNCIPYCRLAQAACPTLFIQTYTNEAGCLMECRQLADAAAGSHYSIPTAQIGNTLKCRTLSAARALEKPEDQRETVCQSVVGGSPCL
jgi:hypothetical protein